MEKKIEEIIQSLNLQEKVDMIGGYEEFNIHGIEKHNIPPVKMADGPMGIRDNGKATAFPASIGLAATRNRELSYRTGEAIGKECRWKNIGFLLAPGVNIYKYHQNGRNFEYLGEDPVLASKMVVPYIKGVQDQKVVATVKHFICNNQDYERHMISSNVDEKTLNEIYFPAFKAAVQEAGVKAVMMSYNPINDIQASENFYLMTDILRKQWGFKGVVMSDWVSVYSEKCVKAGLDLEMPAGAFMNYDNISKLIENGDITEDIIDEKVRRILTICFEMDLYSQKSENNINWEDHHQVAYKVASESIVLLQNNNNILPIDPEKNLLIAIIGEKCLNIPASGGGSCIVKEFSDTSIVKELGKIGLFNIEYFDTIEGKDLSKYDYVITAVGYTSKQEGEAIDRLFNLYKEDIEMLESINKQNSNVIALIISGSGIFMDKAIKSSSAILHCWYPGEAGAKAIVDIIIGKTNPSGKLPFSWEKTLEDSPVYKAYKDIIDKVPVTGGWSIFGKEHENYPLEYSEGIYFGKRYYDSNKIELEYEFGYGLSYSEFEISGLKTDKESYAKNDNININFTISNLSKVDGKETIHLYVENINSSTKRNFKELKDFQKILIPAKTLIHTYFSISAEEITKYDDVMDTVKKYKLYVNNEEIEISIDL